MYTFFSLACFLVASDTEKIFLKPYIAFDSCDDVNQVAHISVFIVNESDECIRFPLGDSSTVRNHHVQKMYGNIEVITFSFSPDWINCNGKKTFARLGDRDLNVDNLNPGEAAKVGFVRIENFDWRHEWIIVYEVREEFGHLYDTWFGSVESVLKNDPPE